MKAVITSDYGDSEIKEIPRPDNPPDNVLIEVNRVQLSITEARMYSGRDLEYSEAIQQRLEKNGGDGQLFGHEFCGTVVEVGSNTDEYSEGDRVFTPSGISCHNCSYCRSGFLGFCNDREYIGFHRPGALAEYLSLPPEPLYKIPDGISDAEGAALQPLTSCSVSVHNANIAEGDVIAVIGAGVMGNQCGQLALSNGASTVFAVDVLQEKVDLANSHGMIGINGQKEDPVSVIQEETNGIGADIVFESVGNDQDHGTQGNDPLAQAFRMVRRGGKIMQVGTMEGELTLEPLAMREKCVDWLNPDDDRGTIVTGPNSDTGQAVLQLLTSGRISISEFITHELKGLDSFEKAIGITLDKGKHSAFGPAQLILGN